MKQQAATEKLHCGFPGRTVLTQAGILYAPRNIFSCFGATGIHTDFPKVLPRHYLHQTMKPENSLSCSEQPAPGPHLEQHKSGKRHSIFYVLSLSFSKILSSRLCLQLFLKDFPNKTLFAFLFSPFLSHALPN